MGPIRGQGSQANMPSMDQIAHDHGGVSPGDERIVFVHLLLYGFDMQAPSVADAREWAEHFGLDQRPNHLVLVGDPRMLNNVTYLMIPGLQLVDRDFVLRYDGAGRNAPHDVWTGLWPGVAGALGWS